MPTLYSCSQPACKTHKGTQKSGSQAGLSLIETLIIIVISGIVFAFSTAWIGRLLEAHYLAHDQARQATQLHAMATRLAVEVLCAASAEADEDQIRISDIYDKKKLIYLDNNQLMIRVKNNEYPLMDGIKSFKPKSRSSEYINYIEMHIELDNKFHIKNEVTLIAPKDNQYTCPP